MPMLNSPDWMDDYSLSIVRSRLERNDLNKNNVLVVTVLPRSGTSAIAGVLHHLGIDMIRGKINNEPRKDKYNSKGYYENMAVVNLNVRTTNTRTFNEMVEAIDISNGGHVFEFATELAYVQSVAKMSLNAGPCGVKDPRFILPGLLEKFVAELKDHFYPENIKIIVTKRSILSTIDSLKSIKGIDLSSYSDDDLYDILSNGWINAVARIDENLGCDFNVFDYDELVRNPPYVIGEIAEFCNVPIVKEAINFIDPSLKRF